MASTRNTHTTQQLVLRIHGGDRDAFNQLFMRYYPRIKLLVRLQMLDKLKAQVEPDDIIQEIYLEVFRNFHKFEYRDPDSFYKWVVTVIGWKIRDSDKYFFKTQKRRLGETVSLSRESAASERPAALADLVAGPTPTPSQIVMQKEGYRMLERALESLPVHFRRIIQLRHLEQRTPAEAAEILAMTPNAVNVLFHRAQKRLHEVLKDMSFFQT
jgi:RNA polymerase sigma-70 factor (ECF subfamily)